MTTVLRIRAAGGDDLVEALARGIGATAAHELGHQYGLGFTHDVSCSDCYDGGTSDTRAHYFGPLHWSQRAQEEMKKVLPPGSE